MEQNRKELDRRGFLKKFGIGAAAVSAASLYGCAGKKSVGNADNSPEIGEVPKDQMTYRSFPGLGGDKASILGYGCMRWPVIPNPDGEGEIIDQEQVNRLVDYAIEHGVNFFDCAPVYVRGQSEKATGIALKRHPRESYYISTKLSNMSNSSRENSIRMYKKSLENFQTDYIDYYLLHNLGRGGMERVRERFFDNGVLDFLLEERKAGRIRHLGWSFHGSKELFDEMLSMHEKYHWDFVLIQMNYLDWKIPKGSKISAEYMYEELSKRGIPIMIMEPLLGGRLAKLPDHIVTRLKEKEPQRSVASWAFRFAGSHPGVLTVLSGMTYMEHLQDNIRSFSPLKPLDEGEREFLYETARLINQYPTVPCNDCKYCMPCPYGLDIPAILLHYNKCLNEGNISMSSQDENYAKARRAYLVGYDRSVPKLRQASHCVGCRECIEHCPQEIDIPRELLKIDRYVEKLKRGTL
ncbi:MAG: aldo/keto reductase [Bacteroidales bacterium]|nr:aldo/keto reductase [Bacteroidales bacterium]